MIRKYTSSDLEILREITIICFERVSIDKNIEDEYAVQLHFKDTMIGHIPRSDNKHIFRLIEQDKDLVCTIREIDPDAETWQMCKVKVEMVG